MVKNSRPDGSQFDPYAVYRPGWGFESVVSLSGGAEIVRLQLQKFRMLDQWPEDISRLGIYAFEPVDPGEAFNPEAIAARAAAGKTGGYSPLFLVSEVPGARIERYPCTHCDGFHPDSDSTCEACEGVGYLDAEGESWIYGPDVFFRTQWEFEPPPSIYDDDDGLGVPIGCANALAIILGIGAIIYLARWAVTGSLL